MNKTLGWFLDPMIRGTYPNVLFENLDFKFKFSETEQYLLKNSFNFIGINHYTTYYMDANFNYSLNNTGVLNDEWWLLIVSIIIGLVACLIPSIQVYRMDISKTLSDE